MRRHLLNGAVALLLAAAGPLAWADDGLYRALGGTPGLQRLMDDFVPRLYADPRLAAFFKDTKAAELNKQLVSQFCEVTGGPCRHEGPTMKEAHEGFEIRRRDFNALVEVLQDAMDAQGLPFGVQNRLLARLAPMHRDIVNTP
jgi:hemoglobin